MPGYMYILECADGSFYTGSTKNLEKRMQEHRSGKGAIHTKSRLPVKLLYYEKYWSVKDAFEREKQIQNWSRKKKLALINRNIKDLELYSNCQNSSTSKRIYEWKHPKNDK